MRTAAALAFLVFALPAAAQTLPFAGAWRGTWTDAGTGQSGALSITIAPDGAASGVVSNAQANLSGPVVGGVAPDGRALFAYRYREGDIYHADGTFMLRNCQLAGTFDFASNGMKFARGLFTLSPAGRAADTAAARPSQAVPASCR